MPKRVASTRSYAVGVPPRSTCPRIVTRVSNPVRRSISGARSLLIPPRRTWPNSSASADWSAIVPSTGTRAFGDDHDREVGAPPVPVLDAVAHLVDVERLLGHEDDVGAAGDPRVRRDPTGVAAHHLDDHHPVVALGRRVQPVDGVGGDLHRGVEPEREVGRREVVVDGLRHADELHAVGAELGGDAEGVLAADRDQRVDPLAFERVVHARDTVLGLVRIRARACRGSCPRGGAVLGCWPSSGRRSRRSMTPRQPWRNPTRLCP